MVTLHNAIGYLWNPWAGGVLALVGSAMVRALPTPLASGSRFYLWFYGFAQILLANFDKSTISISAVPAASGAVVAPTAAVAAAAAPVKS